ncbi:MAG: hypothetical protein AMJ89_00110 [candidate division Zixibacteria bacterium SM23_73]|nr:MAG: hypothetical protein AMJ89_00110 [candidate division Zixibacteria bacterium SM23_73]
MKCPICKIELKKSTLANTAIDYCPVCLGVWFEKDELRQAKDEKDKDLIWLDIDLWKDKDKFKVLKGEFLCPFCQVPLYEIYYGDSDIKIEACNVCNGVWLDRGEFRQIVKFLKEKAKYEILENYFSNLVKETFEIFRGPESLREEILDLLAILKILRYKLVVKFPDISNIVSNLQKRS